MMWMSLTSIGNWKYWTLEREASILKSYKCWTSKYFFRMKFVRQNFTEKSTFSSDENARGRLSALIEVNFLLKMEIKHWNLRAVSCRVKNWFSLHRESGSWNSSSSDVSSGILILRETVLASSCDNSSEAHSKNTKEMVRGERAYNEMRHIKNSHKL